MEPRHPEDAALGIVLNLGYNGSRSNHLDVKLAPRALSRRSPATNPSSLLFNYDEAAAYYKMNAGNGAGEQAAVAAASRSAPTTSTGTPSTMPPRSTAAAGRWCRTGRTSPHKKDTRSRHSPPGERHLSLRAALRPRQALGHYGRGLAHPRRLLRLRQLQLRHRRLAFARPIRSTPPTSSAARQARCGPISTGIRSRPAAARCVSGSTPRPITPPAANTRLLRLTSATRRATPLKGREQSRTIWRSQNHADGRNAQHGDSRHHQQRL